MSNVMYNFFIKHFPAQYNATLFQKIKKISIIKKLNLRAIKLWIMFIRFVVLLVHILKPNTIFLLKVKLEF